jgi:group I intron endonuclease
MSDYMKIYGVVYKITNQVNDKMYVGKKACKSTQWFEHSNYYGSGKILPLAIQKYGIENFKREVCFICFSKDQLNEMEKHYIKLFESITPKGYNISAGGNGGCGFGINNHQYGKKGKLHHWFGRKHSLKTIENMSGENSILFGNHPSEETRKLMKENRLDTHGEKHPMFGKHHSEESNQKNRLSHLDTHHKESTKIKMSISHKNKIDGELNPQAKLNKDKVFQIREYLKNKTYTQKEISTLYGISQSTVSEIFCNKLWKNIGRENCHKH